MDAYKSTRPTILVVEDNEINRELLIEYLSDSYNILSAFDGVEAMEIIEEHMREISLVLLDLVMPNVNGFEMPEEMNEYGWIESVPVAIISSEKSNDPPKSAHLHKGRTRMAAVYGHADNAIK